MKELERYWHRKFDELALLDIPEWQRSSWRHIRFVNDQRKYLEYNLNRHHSGDLDKTVVADLGCGPGLYMDLILEKGGLALGLDFSLETLKRNHYSGDRRILGLIGGEISNLPLKQNTLDVALLFGVLQTADNPCEYLLNVSKAMKPGGMFLMTTLRQHSIWELPFWPLYMLLAHGYYPDVKSGGSELIRSREILFPMGQDEKSQILKRYKKNQLKRWLNKCGFHKIHFSYDNPGALLPHIDYNSIMIYVKAYKK